MYSLTKKEVSVREFIYLFAILLTFITIQVFIVNSFSRYAILFELFFILFLISVIMYLDFLKDFSIFLLIITFLPLLLLNNDFHYDFNLELISFIPLFILFLFAIFTYFLNEKSFSFNVGYLELPVILIGIFWGISALFGIFSGRNGTWILIEFFHICLYLSIIPVSYLIKKREKYLVILKILILISILISVEYLIYDLYLVNGRFVTFQSGFMPLAIGVVFAYFLFSKHVVKKFGTIFVLGILIAGTFVTLTRTLWIITTLVLILTYLIYVKLNNKLNFIRIASLIIILITSSLVFKGSTQHVQAKSVVLQSVKYRTGSISNPLEDSSFLMRIEFGYYAIQRFLEKPIWGSGLGDYLKYKIVFVSNLPNYYTDSSWLYFLWKGGAIGFLLFLWLYIRFFKGAYFVSKNSRDVRVKYICVGLLAGFIGLSFLAFLSPILIKYKTNALIAFLFAYVEYERNLLLKGDIKTNTKTLLDNSE